jgi:hypothetical protein
MLSIFLGSLNGFSNLAEVKPYTELITVFNAFDKSLSENSPFLALDTNGTSFPSRTLLKPT